MAGQSEFESVLRELAQQQSALSQQQTALLQLQTESLRLQRLLIERAMGGAPTEEVATVVTTERAHRGAPEPVESAQARSIGCTTRGRRGERAACHAVHGDAARRRLTVR